MREAEYRADLSRNGYLRRLGTSVFMNDMIYMFIVTLLIAVGYISI